jgi:hypothetical protein
MFTVWIAGWKRWNAIDQHQVLFSLCIQWWLRNWQVLKYVDADEIHRNNMFPANNDCMHFVQYCVTAKACWYVSKVSVNGASTTFWLTHSAINGLHGHILPMTKYWPSLYIRRHVTRSLPHPRNERQRSINNNRSCILNSLWSVQTYWPIITILAAFIRKNTCDNLATTS